MTYQPELPIPDPDAQAKAQRRDAKVRRLGRTAYWLRMLGRRQQRRLREATDPTPPTPDQEDK